MTVPLIELESVTKHFPVGQKLWGPVTRVVHAVDDISLTIAPGETLGLVGETGSGKSTLGRVILHLHPPTAGRVLYRGADVATMNAPALRKLRGQAQIVFQDPYSSFDPRMTIGDIVAEGMVHSAHRDRAARLARVRELLKLVGLGHVHTDLYPHQFSGGQRQRIGIARALAVQPDFLVCDEAVAALDVSIQAQILNLFMDLRAELDLTYLFISHDLGVVEHLSDRVVIMYLGRIVEEAPAEEIFRRPNHPYTQALLAEVPRIDTRKRQFTAIKGEIPSPLNPPPGCHFHPRCPHAMTVCREKVPVLRDVASAHRSACHLNDAA